MSTMLALLIPLLLLAGGKLSPNPLLSPLWGVWVTPWVTVTPLCRLPLCHAARWVTGCEWAGCGTVQLAMAGEQHGLVWVGVEVLGVRAKVGVRVEAEIGVKFGTGGYG